MIDLYTWPTPNGFKVSIMLEEVGLPYNVIPIDITKGDQFDADYLKISPNNKMPAIVDNDGPGDAPYPLFESGAILMYLAEKTGQFMPADMDSRYLVIQWLMFQMGGIGPMFGQAHHFRTYAPENLSYAVDRYTNETGRLYRVLEHRLGDVEYLAGEYSIADMAAFPWTRGYERQGQSLDDLPNVKRWFDAISARPAVERGLTVLAERRQENWHQDKEAFSIMFGDKQYARS